MFSLPIPQILVSLHSDITTTQSFGERIASTIQKMGNSASAAVDELSEELAALLDATNIASTSTSSRDELYSFFDDGFDDDAEEIPENAGARTPARIGTPAPSERYSQGYFALPTKFRPETAQYRPITPRNECQKENIVPEMVDEGYCSSESDDADMDLCEEDKEALLPAKRFSWRASSPERCSLLYWEE